MFGCLEWYPGKTDLRLIEKLQNYVTKWICWSEPDNKKRFTETALLRLSLYAELQRLLFYCSIIDGSYDIEISNFTNIKANERTRESTNNEIVRQKKRLHKIDENFWHRVAILFNIVSNNISNKSNFLKYLQFFQVFDFFLRQGRWDLLQCLEIGCVVISGVIWMMISFFNDISYFSFWIRLKFFPN